MSLGSANDPTQAGGETSPPSWPSASSGTRVGRYLLLDRVGAGGMGVVWRAYDPMLDRRVALKLVASRGGDPTELVSEAQALARLQHPNIVAIYDVGPLPEGMFLAMEYVDGVTLTRHLRLPHTWREIVDVFLDIAKALRAAHGAGVVHGDLKPDNVLVGANAAGGPAVVKVVDFGLASMVTSPSHPGDRLRTTGNAGATSSDRSIRGTPAYLAPEQVAGAPASARSDQYAFCVAMFEALTGSRPHAIDSIHAAAVVFSDRRTVRWPSGTPVPRWLRRLVLTGLAPEPDARHDDFDEIVRALERGRTRLRRRAGIALAATVAVVSAVTLIRGAVRCSDADEAVTAVWNETIAAEIEGELRTGASTGEPSTWRRRQEQFDATAEDLAAASRLACESGETLDARRRLRCIDHGLGLLGASVEQLRGGDVRSKHFVLAGAGLEVLPHCEDDAELQQFSPVAEQPRLRALVQELEHDIGLLSISDITTPDVTDDRIAALGERARLLGEVGAYTDVLLLRARSAQLHEDPELMRRTLREALSSAEASRDDRRVAMSWLRMAAAETGSLGDPAVLAVALERVDAASERLGRPPDLESQRHRALALAAGARGNFLEGLHEFELTRRAAAEAHRSDVILDSWLGSVSYYLNSDRIGEAQEAAEAAFQLASAVFGEDHPDVGVALGARASAMLAAARHGGDAEFDRADAAFDLALERLAPWEQLRPGTGRALECNRCVGLIDACRPQAVAACVRCGQRSQGTALTSASQRTMAIALGSLAMSDPSAAVPIARAELARWRDSGAPQKPGAAQLWSTLILAANGDREPALELLADLGPRGLDSLAALMLDALLATRSDDPERRRAALDRLRSGHLDEDLRTADKLVRAWWVAQLSGEPADREVVAGLAVTIAPQCSPGWRPSIDAWLATPPAPSALAREGASAEPHGDGD